MSKQLRAPGPATSAAQEAANQPHRLTFCTLAVRQGLTLVHCLAQLKRFLWDQG